MSKKMFPYIPNSEEKVQQEMLDYIGVKSIEDLISDIPEDMRMKHKMELPEPFCDEAGLARHVNGILGKNKGSRATSTESSARTRPRRSLYASSARAATTATSRRSSTRS